MEIINFSISKDNQYVSSELFNDFFFNLDICEFVSFETKPFVSYVLCGPLLRGDIFICTYLGQTFASRKRSFRTLKNEKKNESIVVPVGNVVIVQYILIFYK